ncbi:DUF7344 domain-containing protein [Halorussus marinus]|uniref:DUF7344 domain-containing protein n=1 Tax=Halorussus marinus TaxID=2505976 RepID=UPI00106E8E42|nr:hypothetical protein [Halorussus marinus]
MNGPSLDDLLRLLANRRCRYVLYCLDEADRTVLGLDELADRVVCRECEWDDAAGTDTSAHRRTVTIELHHNHLPRLAAAGAIDYDARTRTVRNRRHASLAEWIDGDANELPHLRSLLAPSRA